jgi:hypothetical protein
MGERADGNAALKADEALKIYVPSRDAYRDANQGDIDELQMLRFFHIRKERLLAKLAALDPYDTEHKRVLSEVENSLSSLPPVPRVAIG